MEASISSKIFSSRLLKIYSRLQELNREDVKILAVSKTRSMEEILSLLDVANLDLGENYFSEAKAKILEMKENDKHKATWHYIGVLQSGNVRQVVRYFSWIHGVGSLSSLDGLAKSSLKNSSIFQEEHLPIRYFIQLNLTGEKTKLGGMSPSEFLSISKFPENEALEFSGLMTMGPKNYDLVHTREVFHQLREMRNQYVPQGLLNMGMSKDWEIAVEEGSDLIRLGTALFGMRVQNDN